MHVWGVNITRRTVRNNEVVRIVNTKKGETGFVSHFADIDGLEGIHRGKPLELVPYSVARSDICSRAATANNPLLQRSDYKADGGLDVKYALTSSLTLTGTINPDFGQVEVDPAVVNLSQFETFYPEKRPFFTEGLNIFRFGDTPAPSHFNFFFPPSLFYTRRIGRSPQGSPDADFVDIPVRDHDPRRGENHRKDRRLVDRRPRRAHRRRARALRERRDVRTAAGRADDELLHLARHERDRRQIARRIHAHVRQSPRAGRAVVPARFGGVGRRRRLHELREEIVDSGRVAGRIGDQRERAVDRHRAGRRRRATTSVRTRRTCISIRRARRSKDGAAGP